MSFGQWSWCSRCWEPTCDDRGPPTRLPATRATLDSPLAYGTFLCTSFLAGTLVFKRLASWLIDAFLGKVAHQRMYYAQEGRAALAAVRATVRDFSGTAHRRLVLVDTVSIAVALEKERWQSLDILQLCRRLGAVELATHDLFRWRWVPSERNPADSQSRHFQFGQISQVRGHEHRLNSLAGVPPCDKPACQNTARCSPTLVTYEHLPETQLPARANRRSMNDFLKPCDRGRNGSTGHLLKNLRSDSREPPVLSFSALHEACGEDMNPSVLPRDLPFQTKLAPSSSAASLRKMCAWGSS